MGDGFIAEEARGLFRSIMLILNIAAGFLFFSKNRYSTLVLFVFLLLIIGEETVQFLGEYDLRQPIGIGYLCYFVVLSTKVFQTIYRTKNVGREMLAAVFCGLIMLALIGSFLFMTLEMAYPGSFSNLGDLNERYQNIQYFSFITTLTIGYGDIAPLTMMAKQLTILIGLAGHFYSVIVVGIVIGKYLHKE